DEQLSRKTIVTPVLSPRHDGPERIPIDVERVWIRHRTGTLDRDARAVAVGKSDIELTDLAVRTHDGSRIAEAERATVNELLCMHDRMGKPRFVEQGRLARVRNLVGGPHERAESTAARAEIARACRSQLEPNEVALVTCPDSLEHRLKVRRCAIRLILKR